MRFVRPGKAKSRMIERRVLCMECNILSKYIFSSNEHVLFMVSFGPGEVASNVVTRFISLVSE